LQQDVCALTCSERQIPGIDLVCFDEVHKARAIACESILQSQFSLRIEEAVSRCQE
jgi:hypothetical protein